jgi:hypothetical protein
MADKVDLWALSDLAAPWCVRVAVPLGVAERICRDDHEDADCPKKWTAWQSQSRRAGRQARRCNERPARRPSYRPPYLPGSLRAPGLGGPGRRSRPRSQLRHPTSVALHWIPPHSGQIFESAGVAAPNGRVVVVGGVSPESTPAMGGLLIVVLTGGQTRTLDQFRAVAAKAGLKFTAVGNGPSGRLIIESRPN